MFDCSNTSTGATEAKSGCILHPFKQHLAQEVPRPTASNRYDYTQNSVGLKITGAGPGFDTVKLAFHDADTDKDTDTDTDFLARILARKSRVSGVRLYRRVGRVGVGVGVRVGVVEYQRSSDTLSEPASSRLRPTRSPPTSFFIVTAAA